MGKKDLTFHSDCGRYSIGKIRGLAHSRRSDTIMPMDTSQFATGMLPVLYEDDQLIAVEKPAGLLSQPSADEEDSVLTRVSSYLGRRAGLVQRLDRPVSGMLVLAKNAKTTRWLNKCIARGKCNK